MKAVIYNKKSKEKKFQLVELDKPKLGNGEVLVKVHFSSVNAADCRLMKMGMVPKNKIFGADISGVIEAISEDVQNWQVGDRVLGELSGFDFGGFAESVSVPALSLVKLPKEISFEHAASLPLAGVTALQALRNEGKIQSGQDVLIVGASGGVGTFTTQLAKLFGAIVTGVCSSKNLEQTKNLGADRVIDYTKEDFINTKDSYDLIIAINGNYSLLSYKKKLNQNGKLVLVGGSLSQIFKSLIFGKFLSIGSKKVSNLFAKSNLSDLEYLVSLVQGEKIKPVIEKIYNLENVESAMQYVAEGHSTGKVLVKIGER